MKTCIDLCCGLKGFSQAFAEDPNWEVITVDIERKFKPTIQADVRFLPLRQGLMPDVLLMSPPCERFSRASFGRGNTGFPNKGIRLACEIVGACLEATVELDAKRWLLENPLARLRYIIGTPDHTIYYSEYGSEFLKPTDLWGNIPLPMVQAVKRQKKNWMIDADYASLSLDERGKIRHREWTKKTKSNAAERAKVPYGLSKAVKISVENN